MNHFQAISDLVDHIEELARRYEIKESAATDGREAASNRIYAAAHRNITSLMRDTYTGGIGNPPFRFFRSVARLCAPR